MNAYARCYHKAPPALWPACRTRRRQTRENLPFGIGQVAFMAQMISTTLARHARRPSIDGAQPMTSRGAPALARISQRVDGF
jgi:hypothetical protein